MDFKAFSQSLRHFSKVDQTQIERAFALGEKVHDGQKRKSGEPYFIHPVAVAIMLIDIGADAETVIAALLHDTVEDTDLTLTTIKEQFSDDIAALIDGVTKLDANDFIDTPSMNEQTETLRKMFTLMTEDARIMVIKLVDRLHNMQTVEFLPEEKRHALAQETYDIYVKIADRLCMADMRDALEQASLQVLNPKLLTELEHLRKSNERKAHGIMQEFRNSIKKNTPSLHIETHFEPKSWDNLELQHTVDNDAVTGVTGITIVFLCKDIDDCYRTLGALHNLWQRESLSFQDFINSPAINGYRGLHTTVIMEDGVRVRCKIRTNEMDEYARKGITTRCFDSEVMGIFDYLPWADRIEPLAEDTADRSEEFWLSLQSDILGESIMIHGTGDHTVMLPKGATALDGAFYCFHEKALRLRRIYVDGQEVPLATPLVHGASLDIALSRRSTVHRDWLHWVRTGVGTAQIREALARQSEKKKLAVGKQLLQELMESRRMGYIEEFDRKTLLSKLRTSGYDSMEDAYSAIADGKATAEDIADILFTGKSGIFHSDRPRRTATTITCSIEDEHATPEIITALYKTYDDELTSIRLLNKKHDDDPQIEIQGNFTRNTRTSIKKMILKNGGYDIGVRMSSKRITLLTALVILLWGLNPVMAKWFLTHNMSAVDLITIRLLAYGVFAACTFVLWRIFSTQRYTRVPHIIRISLLPTLGLIGMTVFNYLALELIDPSVHITILRLNVLLLPLLAFIQKRKGVTRQATLGVLALFVASIAMMIFIPSGPDITGIAFSLLALASYTAYSLFSEHVLNREKINMRYPIYLLSVGILMGCAGLGLVAIHGTDAVADPYALQAAIYVLFCVFLPHVFYGTILRSRKFSYFADALLLEVPIAIFFEVILLGSVLHLPLYIVITAIVSIVLLYRWRNQWLH